MKLRLFAVGVVMAACFGAAGLLIDAASEHGIQYLTNDLIAIVLVGCLAGSALALLGSFLEDYGR